MFDTESIDKPVVGFAIPIHIVAGDDASEAGDDSAQCDLMYRVIVFKSFHLTS